MPRKEINYSKTIFYRLVCNDINIIDCYVGHTTNFIKRKQSHKQRCNKEDNDKYNLNVYKFIRDNGGWANWSMIVINEHCCNDLNDALRQERLYLEEYKATLNKVKPTRTNKEWENDNLKHLQEYRINYANDNNDKIKKYKNNYYNENKETLYKIYKNYRLNNKELLKEKQKELIYCDCCKINIRKGDISRHYKTNKHIKNIESTEIII